VCRALASLLLCVALLLPPSGVAAAGKPTSVAGIERAIRGCANRNREAAGLEPLVASGVLGKAARLHARNMAIDGFFDHEDPQGRGPAERVEIFDTHHEFFFVGENIAAGYASAAVACQGWMHSPGHRANILNDDYTRIGAGFARGGPFGRYYVQVFAKGGQPEHG
jgi:uncharacterized protein YkwD